MNELQKIQNKMKKYESTFESKNLTPWFKNPLSLKIMEKKYLYPNEKSADQLIKRVSSIFSKDIKDKVQDLLISGTFFPGGRSLYGIGSKGQFNATTSNCYILPTPKDSLDSIYESNKEIATIFKAGGGIGIDLSTLRPNGAKTNNAARTSTGAVSFMHLYNTTGSIIGFHGRRGATLVGLRISHPDIEEFVNLRSTADMKAMNISCIIDDKFMHAVEKDEDYELWFDVEATGEKIRKTIKAKELYYKICQMNWDYGDPGMLFKNSVDTNNLMAGEPRFKIDICNPCAEYTGPAYNSCNLGSLNLAHYVRDPYTRNSMFEWDKFMDDVETAVWALDEILDYGYDLQPLDKNREIIDQWRAIGLGFFGYADMLVGLEMTYGSPAAIEFTEGLCKHFMSAAIKASSRRAKELGSFANFDADNVLKSPLIGRLDDPEIAKMIKTNGLRNSQLISIAPTGSLALLAGSFSSGIEPIFKCQYERSTHGLEDQNISFTVADASIMGLLDHYGIEPGTMSTEEIKERFPYVVEAADIKPIDRVKTQAAMQKYIDNAISSTVNLPESATVDDVCTIYWEAWSRGLKGITVFRDNCKRASILGFSSKKDEKTEKDAKLNHLEPIARKGLGPLDGRTYRKRTACVKALYVTVNSDEDGDIFEIFTNKSTHGCAANIATITRLTSLALRSGIKVETIVQELKENSCQACQQLIKAGEKGVSLSCPYAIGEALEEEYKYRQNQIMNRITGQTNEVLKEVPNEKDAPKKLEKESKTSALECPECGERTLIVEGKCTSCKRCGYSKCD